MSEWRETTLGALTAAAGGFIKTGPFGSQLHANEYSDESFGVPVIMPKDMVGGRVARAAVSRVNEVVADRLSNHRLAPGDVVLARRGDIGRYAFVEHDEHGWLCGTGSLRLHAPDHEVVWPGFLRYTMGSPIVVNWLRGQAVGATMPNLNAKIVAGVPIRLPDIATQRRIAALLSTFDELIAINERRIQLLEDLARSIYREWFVRFKFPGWEAAPITQSRIGPVPADWHVGQLREFVTTQYGFTASATEEPIGPHFLRGMDINKRSFTDWSRVPYCVVSPDQREKFRLDVGDVCVIRMADPGKVGIVERAVTAVFASYLVRLRSTDARLPSQLLAHYLRDDAYQGWVTGASTGTTRKSASAAVLTEPLIVLPPVAIADRFEREAGTLRSALTTLVEEDAHLTRTRDLLLPRLVTGRLDIADLDLGDLLAAEAA